MVTIATDGNSFYLRTETGIITTDLPERAYAAVAQLVERRFRKA